MLEKFLSFETNIEKFETIQPSGNGSVRLSPGRTYKHDSHPHQPP